MAEAWLDLRLQGLSSAPQTHPEGCRGRNPVSLNEGSPSCPVRLRDGMQGEQVGRRRIIPALGSKDHQVF
jgi:hypothetical protein